MADFTIPAASVAVTYTAGTPYEAHEEIDPGEAVYVDLADSAKAKLADADAVGKYTVAGVALNHALAGQPVNIIASGDLTVTGAFAAVNEGDFVYLSSTAGKMCPEGDLTTSHYVSVIGYVVDANTLRIAILNTGLLNIATP